MQDEVEMLEMAAEKLEKTVEEVNQVEERLMCQFDTMSELFFEEKKLLLAQMADAEKRHAEERESMRKHYGRALLAVSLTLLLVIGSLIGGLIYLISNYDIGVAIYQEVNAEGGGDSTVEDGIHVDRRLPTE